jgi:hypothetical protein
MYVIERGSADVFVTDRQGVEHRIGRAAEGSTLGEMSLLSGHGASGTVRAAEPIAVRVLTAADFERLSERFPLVYRNLGAILSRRLALTSRLAAGATPARVTRLVDSGSPPLLAYALACSVAWHTRAPTLLLFTGAPPPEFAPLPRRHSRRGGRRRGVHGSRVERPERLRGPWARRRRRGAAPRRRG